MKTILTAVAIFTLTASSALAAGTGAADREAANARLAERLRTATLRTIDIAGDKERAMKSPVIINRDSQYHANSVINPGDVKKRQYEREWKW